ncbi:hypothetical protein F5B21DRAFT_268602 [Xylaria acuta]|nr:hypothetical protein F5B21DRAFT_268602 [Xylaria acuta]
MNPSPYDMEGSPQILVSSAYEFGSTNQPNNYNVDNQNEHVLPSFGNQLVPFGSPHWSQGLGLGPSYCPNGVTSDTPNSSCGFRSDVLDDCAKARFYARFLEFYLLDDQDADLSCPFVDCVAQNFNNAKTMLRHLKHCRHFEKGIFRCPLCGQQESFRARSSSRCRWDKEHLGQKIIRKGKNIVRGLTGTRPETQKPAHTGLCYQCKRSVQDASHATQFIEGYSPIQSTIPVVMPNRMELAMPDVRCELESPPGPSELSVDSCDASIAGDLSSGNSPIHPHPRLGCNNQYLASEVSSATISPDGNKVNTNISPGSSTHEEIPVSTRRPNPESMHKRVTRRLTEFYNEAISSNGIVDQRRASLYSNVPTNYNLESFNTMNMEAFVGPVNLPPTLTLHPSSRDMPKLRLETSPGTLGFTTLTPEFQMPSDSSDVVGYPATTETHTATSPPTSIQPSALSIPNTVLGDNFFIPQSSSAIDTSSSASAFSIPHSQRTSPSSSPSEQELRCPECGFTPSGKPEGHKAYLRKHMNSMHGARSSIQCSHCNRKFTRSDNMLAHCKRYGISSTSPSKRRRASSDSLPSPPPSQPKRRGAVRGRKPCE